MTDEIFYILIFVFTVVGITIGWFFGFNKISYQKKQIALLEDDSKKQNERNKIMEKDLAEEQKKIKIMDRQLLEDKEKVRIMENRLAEDKEKVKVMEGQLEEFKKTNQILEDKNKLQEKELAQRESELRQKEKENRSLREFQQELLGKIQNFANQQRDAAKKNAFWGLVKDVAVKYSDEIIDTVKRYSPF